MVKGKISIQHKTSRIALDAPSLNIYQLGTCQNWKKQKKEEEFLDSEQI